MDARGEAARKKKHMTNEEHTPEEQKGIEHYLAILSRQHMSADTAKEITAIRHQYYSTGYIEATKIGILQRCFRRATHNLYEIDWFPINVLDMAIAVELNGAPTKALLHHDVTRGLKYLGNIRCERLGQDANAEVKTIESQLLLTGWISREQMEVLRRACLFSNAMIMPSTGDRWRMGRVERK